MDYYLYAETAFHHEGDEVYLRELIDAVASTGVRGIKFQVLVNVNEFVSSRHQAYASICDWVFTLEQWRGFFQLALDKGLEIVMMPLDTKAFLLAEEFPVAHLDLHSVSFFDSALLERMRKTDTSVILGAGGRTLEEIEAKVRFFKGQPVVLMTGFQAFPSDLAEVRLGRIAYFKARYPQLSIGYADHTSYEDPYALTSLEYAYLEGARFFEKHVTLDEGKKRVDFEAAVGVDKLRSIKARLDYLQTLFALAGEDSLQMSPAEFRYRERQKFAVAKKALAAGQVLGPEDLQLKITDEGSGFANCEALVGRKLNCAVTSDEVITKDSIR